MNQSRRIFIKGCAFATTTAAAAATFGSTRFASKQKGFQISVDEFSLDNTMQGHEGEKISHLDFARVAREKCGIDAIGYLGRQFEKPPSDAKYLAEMNQRASDYGVEQTLIMVSLQKGVLLDDPDAKRRQQAANNHHPWVEAAATLGCHSIRVNVGRFYQRTNELDFEERAKLAVDGLSRLVEFSATHKVSVIVENHGGPSSNGKWLARVMQRVGSSYCGTLPDFGNFQISRRVKPSWIDEYDRYQGIEELMPFAKSVSAKATHFDAAGNEANTDYYRMLDIVLEAGYHGHVGIEYHKYEASQLSEIEGILATKRLLERVREKLTVDG